MKTASINLDVLAAVFLCVSKEETRYYLNGVHLEIEPRTVTYIATDGHRLMVYRDELASEAPDNTLLGRLIIPSANCKPFKRAKRSDAGCVLSGDTIEGPLTFSYGDMSIGFRALDGTFPDWRRIIPSKVDDAQSNITFNWKYVYSFQQMADTLDMGIMPTLVPNGGGPAFVWFGDHDHCFGVIMPQRASDMTQRTSPAWLSAPQTLETAAE